MIKTYAFIAMVGLAPACASAPQARAVPETHAPQAGGPPCTMREGKDGTIFSCMPEHAIMIAPGTGWQVGVATAPEFLLASRGYFHVSMMATNDVSQEGLEAHLRARYGVARAPENTRVGPPRLAKTASARPVLYYEIEGLVVDGRPVRSIHVWSALQRPDGRYVEYHSSWTGPADDPDLSQTESHAPLELRLVNYADGFVTIDDSGHSVPQAP